MGQGVSKQRLSTKRILMKLKKETITVAVQITVQYEPDIKGAREHIVGEAVKTLPSDLCGASISYGSYSAKRGKSYLLPAKV